MRLIDQERRKVLRRFLDTYRETGYLTLALRVLRGRFPQYIKDYPDLLAEYQEITADAKKDHTKRRTTKGDGFGLHG